MTEVPKDLLPCPFCGAGVFAMNKTKHWTGMRSITLSVSIEHTCIGNRENGVERLTIVSKGKTLDDAIRIWNTRK